MNFYGPKGERGPRCFDTELGLVGYLVAELERAKSPNNVVCVGERHSSQVLIDYYTLTQILCALHNYEVLLGKALHELVAPYFFHTCHANEKMNGIE